MTVIEGTELGTFWVLREDRIPCSVCYGGGTVEAAKCASNRLSRFVRDGIVSKLESGQKVICPGPQSSEGFRRVDTIT